MHNLTTGPPTRLILAFTVPLLIGNLFQQLYTFTDAAVVGRLLGLDALAAVGASGGLLFLLVGFSWGASAGLAIPVSRAFGAGDLDGARGGVPADAVQVAGTPPRAPTPRPASRPSSRSSVSCSRETC